MRLQTDERLAQLAANGGDTAFEVLVRRHRGALMRACSRILPRGQAEDAVQQGFLSAQQALLRNGPPDRFEPWLHRIAVNAALKELHRIPQDLPLDEERLDGVEQPPETFERRERLRQALGALAALPDGQRRALVMRELEGRSHAEIARSLGLSAGAARQLIHRARGTMRSAVTALTPYGLLARLAGAPGGDQTAEVVAGGAVGALAGKALATAVIAGGIVGGVALAPEERDPLAEAASEQPAGQSQSSGLGGDGSPGSGPGEDRGRGDEGPGHGGKGSGRSDDDDDDDEREDSEDDSSDHGSGDDGDGDEDDASSSGSGSGGSGSGGGSGSSGSGSGDDEPDDD